MIKDIMEGAFDENFPMIIIFSVVIVSIRLVYIIVHKEKFVFYKELLMFLFLIYALLLFYVVTFQDLNYGTNNFIPFHEITRYEFGSKYFIHNIVGNILLFIPFGFFISYIMKTKKIYAPLIISIITSLTIEFTQLKIGRTFDVDDIILNLVGAIIGYIIYLTIKLLEDKFPNIFSKDYIKNILVILLIIIIILLVKRYTFWGIVR